MLRFVLGRLAGLAVTLVVSSFVVFLSLYLAPGSPDAVLFGGRTPSAAARAHIIAEYHLNDPLIVRYGDWVGGILRGDMGTSVVGHQAVSARVGAAAGTTLELVALAAVFMLVLGVGLGLAGAVGGPSVDAMVRRATAVSVGVPSFVASTILISVFAIRLGWFPAFGSGNGFWGRLDSLVLPAIALSLLGCGLIARVTRSTIRLESGKEYVTTSLARGVDGGSVLLRHVVPNAIGPVLTVSGLQVAGLFVGTIIVESAFGLNGLGSLLVQSVDVKDFPTVQAVTLILVTAFVVINMVVDVAQAAIDPRLRRRASA